MNFKTPLLVAALVGSLAAVAPAANAAGCVKGAAVGGIAGHVVGHHGLLGATAGCLVGRHHANKKEREAQAQANRSAQHATR
jgi:outer membrane lipoprotein SlyB